MRQTVRRRRIPIGSIAMCLATLLLVVPTAPASAQLAVIENTVNRIENKVDNANDRLITVRDRTATIVGDTAGLQGLITAVDDVRTGLRPEVLTDLIGGLTEVQNLFEYLRDAADAAGPSGNYPDLVALMSSLETLINALLVDAGGPADFSALTGLLQVLPDQALAVAGQAVAAAGVDAAFVAQLDQASLDLAVLTNASLLDDDREDDRNAFLRGGTRCDYYNTHRPGLKGSAYTAGGFGLSAKIVGETLAGIAKTVQTDKEVAIHGYVGLQIKTDIKSAIGKVISAVVGDGLIAVAGSTLLKLRHCELLHYDRIILNELCTLNRGRSPQCMEWSASTEALGLLP